MPSAFAFAFLAMACFTVEGALARALGPEMNVAQVAVIRSMIQLAAIAAILGPRFRSVLRTDRPAMHVSRGLLSATGTVAYFYVFSTLPLGVATVLFFGSVLVTTLASGPVLGERVGWRRWSATLVGFAGILLVLKPGSIAIGAPLFAALFLAVNAAAINLATKGLTRTESTATIMAWIAAIMLICALPWMFVTWTTPDAVTLALMVGIGLSGTVGQFAMIRAYRGADVSAVAPVLYTRIVLAGLIGWWLFDEPLDGWSVLGGLMVMGGALYITLREARLARRS